MHKYRLYGLRISSSRPIKLLEEEGFSRPDLTVNWDVSAPSTPDNAPGWKPVSTRLLDELTDVSLWETEDENGRWMKVVFRVDEVRNLSFVIDQARENLRIYHREDEPAGNLESYFVGPVLSFILRLRGTVCLHSSVVAIDGRAVALAGHATAGKSTLAAGLAGAGAGVLSDDIAAINPQKESFLVQTGYSKVRLRPVAARYLTENPEALPMVYAHRQSRYVSLEKGKIFRSQPLPLGAIYLLGEISDEYRRPFVRPVRSQDKLIELIKNTSGSYVVRGGSRTDEFLVLAEIARRIPVRRLYYAHDISTLPDQCRLILEDFRDLAKQSSTPL
ncbi:MAG: hypothetical protein R2747_18990 [Pyrinomonadaceae bacterium]